MILGIVKYINKSKAYNKTCANRLNGYFDACLYCGERYLCNDMGEMFDILLLQAQYVLIPIRFSGLYCKTVRVCVEVAALIQTQGYLELLACL